MFSLVPILVNEQKNGLRFVRRQLRDTLNPYVIPEERFYEMYRMPPTLAIKLTEEFRPFAEDTDDIPLHLQILSALNFYASGSYQRRVGSDALCCISQSKVSQIIEKLSYIGYKHLSKKFIRFPTSDEEVRRTKDGFQEKYKFPGVIGTVKGIHFYVTSKKQPEIEYLNRKGTVSINAQCVCDANLMTTYLNVQHPGSTHDSIVWMSSSVFTYLDAKYTDGELADTWILGNNEFPLQPFLLVPVQIPDNNLDEAYNKTHRKVREVNERCTGYLKGRFRCFMRNQKLRFNHVDVGYIVSTCFAIQNFLIKNNFDITDVPMVQEDVPSEPLRNQNDEYRLIGSDARNKLIYSLARNSV